MAGIEQMNAGASVSIIENEASRVSIIRNETGEGVMTSYEILDGIYLMLSDFHMSSLESELEHNADVFCLDYCYEGRLEVPLEKGKIYYQKPGDMILDSRENPIRKYILPLNHFHAITLCFFLPGAQESITRKFLDFPMDLEQMRRKFTAHSSPYFVRNHPEVNQIFSNIRHSKNHYKNTYIILKIMELLLLLDSSDIHAVNEVDECFYKLHIEKVKLIHHTITGDLEHHFTLKELSNKYKIPQTAMTNCFKGMYGKPINTYMREYRMNYAAKELLLSDLSIADIGLLVGYTNPSKFSSAFKEVMGKLPKEYRKTRIDDSDKG